MRDKVLRWLQSGASASEGVQLMTEACAPSVVLKLVTAHPAANRRFMITWLCRHFSVEYNHVMTDAKKVEKKPVAFRDEFPFLNLPSCPPELETLASRKFARYHRFRELHAQLRDCTSLDECAAKSRELIENFMENRMIWDELNYYKQHGTCLGRHPIFTAFKRRKSMFAMPVKDLMKRKGQVENNIWRVKNELKKRDKPHLDMERKARLFTYEQELADINRLLGE